MKARCASSRPHTQFWTRGGGRAFAPLVAGAAADILGWVATFLFDVFKTRLQVGIGTGAGLGMPWRTARKIYDGSGGWVFWCGFVPILVCAIPVKHGRLWYARRRVTTDR
jgi:hypothetical protein